MDGDVTTNRTPSLRQRYDLPVGWIIVLAVVGVAAGMIGMAWTTPRLLQQNYTTFTDLPWIVERDRYVTPILVTTVWPADAAALRDPDFQAAVRTATKPTVAWDGISARVEAYLPDGGPWCEAVTLMIRPVSGPLNGVDGDVPIAYTRLTYGAPFPWREVHTLGVPTPAGRASHRWRGVAWAPFFTSLIVWLALPAMLLAAPPVLVRVRRRRRGWCPRCAYDLRGDHARGCAECGWGRTTST